MNLATAFLDASDIYGSTEDAVKSLRTLNGGRVTLDVCSRCHEASGVGTLYATLLREHNRVAIELALLNEHWDDETLFQEARRIIIAQIQHITYKEFLPTLLGEVTTEMPELKLKDQGYYMGYSSSNQAGTFNGVAMSALQVFLSMIPPELDNNTHMAEYLHMVQLTLRTPAQQPSLHIAPALKDGTERGALLVHIGRDHGLPSYQHWLQKCNHSLSQPLSSSMKKLLHRIYTNTEDVDLIVGGILETPTFGVVLGPTFTCLLVHQFISVRNSDRFWYENDIPPSSFSREQLAELRKVTLAGLLCSNVPGLDEVQSQVFVQEDPYLNVRIACSLQPTLGLSPWLEKDVTMKISNEMLSQAVEKAETDVKLRRQREYDLWAKNGGVDPKSPIGTAAAFSKANKQALMLANTSILLEYTSQELMISLNNIRAQRRRRQAFDSGRDNILNFPVDSLNDDFSDGLQNVDITSFISAPLTSPDCNSPDDSGPCDAQSQFRTITGRCNSLRNPNFGKSISTFARLLSPAYEDDVNRPRLNSVTGRPLPSPRLVSTMIHADISNLHNRYSLMLMQFAQFLDHDITFTPVQIGFFASIPDCRACDSPRTVHPECMPISVPRGDHYYPQVNRTTGEQVCFSFMRSLPGQQHLGAREQINQNSAFLDTSQIYGEHSCMARNLRSYGGRLNVTRHPVKGKDLLPQSPVHPECKAPSGYCFIAGDGRASEQPALTAIHTLFMREHNHLVDGLHVVNPHWDDERLYQHGRRILTAVAQHITYNEFLPRILGWNAINLYELKLRPQGYYKGYNPTCNPNIVNEFAAAAFRIGHSLLRPHIPRLSPTYKVVDPPILLRDGFFNPDIIYQVHMIDEIIRGLVSTPMENMDQFVTGEITNHLFEDRHIPHSGVDLIALNIQRGRDHAIRPYNDYRALCNLKRASGFEDLSREIPPEVIVRLKQIYATVDDIDLFPGGMSERPLQGGLVGPTFACIIGIQFRQLRKCDRFWYENEDQIIRFTEAQLGEIRKMTLSKILCENMDIQSDMQRSAFDQPSNFLNPRVPCHSLPHIDLTVWKETPQGCQIGGRSVAVGDSGFPTPCTSCICTVDGAQCASLRITDCGQLLREASRDAIQRDDVCTAQCGFLLQDDSPISSGQDSLDIVFTTTLPPSIPLDSRARNSPNTALVPPLPVLQLPPRRSQRTQQPNAFGGGFRQVSDLSRFLG
ncbi:peroxidasin homolog [Zootermopsis nevadensis]|uniref:peroxidasin homolog n=1 Tax=Zootermopsis nevadensis TaxID=136037 RepID=UPI000B8E97E5|nr:peroxidasin homolog [Zootermopsis nevadensis]